MKLPSSSAHHNTKTSSWRPRNRPRFSLRKRSFLPASSLYGLWVVSPTVFSSQRHFAMKLRFFSLGERFDQNSDAFCALVWVWEPGPWVEAKVLRPVADFLDRVQGEAVEHFMALRAKLLDWIGNLQQSNAAKVKAALEDIVSYIYQPYCLLCREPMPSSHEP